MSAFSVVVADPPWSFNDKLPGEGRGAEKHYRVMTIDEICAMAILPAHRSDRLMLSLCGQSVPIADDAILFLWRVASQVEEACHVVRAWGFTAKSEIVWKKLTKYGKRAFGMGRTVRMEHEICMIATRGRPTIKVRNVRSVFEAPLGRHSEKPQAFYEIVEQLVDGPYLELFARHVRPGWAVLGDEIDERAINSKADRRGDVDEVIIT
jgi:N6-adenosine-specific RNA methylase IME4